MGLSEKIDVGAVSSRIPPSQFKLEGRGSRTGKKPGTDQREDIMVNIYLFIELLHTASAVTTVDTLKALSLDNCKFANVVVLSEEKIVAQLDCQDSTDGDKAILNKIAKVDGVVQTNIIAVVHPVKK